MVSAMKLVFVAVAVICYMQTAEMSPLPADNSEAPALPANLLENISNPEFWNALTQNVQKSVGEDNLKKMGINPDEVMKALNNVANEFQKNLAKAFEQQPTANKE